ncbi:MAG: SIMPL domain-containing protein [Puniceicoccaceae bacterium]
MKKINILILALLPTLVFGEFEEPHISVFGTAETKATPDQLIWSLTIKTPGGLVEKLAPLHLEQVAEVLKYIEGEEVVEGSIKTANMRITENWVYRNNSRLMEGYYALTSISFLSEKLEDYVKHWTALSKFKNLTVNNVFFDVSDRIEIQKATRKQAIEAAKEKAEEMANILGVNLREPLMLEEFYGGFDQSSGFAMNRSMGGSEVFELSPFTVNTDITEGSMAPGKESIVMRVKLVYRISK